MSDSGQEGWPPEHNLTGQDFNARSHLGYHGAPLIDVHAHVTIGREGEPGLAGPENLMAVAEEFGVFRVWTMCPPEDIPPLRARFGSRLGFNGPIAKKPDEPDEAAYQLLDRFLEQGVGMIKFWSAPRGRDRGLFVDAPWRVESARRARAAGVRVVMVHVADPDTWFRTVYQDTSRFGTKADQYVGFERMLQMFPDLTWIGAHMGGDPERPEHLETLLDRYPHLYFDTSATKWQVREVSARREAVGDLIRRHPDRFLFGSDLVTRPGLPREHYVSRYWCQRTLWESTWEGRSPIDDPDWDLASGPSSPPLRGLGLPPEVLEQVYSRNAQRLLPA
jgi:predicted TIM-barrel fold metal-dependent hydrolase